MLFSVLYSPEAALMLRAWMSLKDDGNEGFQASTGSSFEFAYTEDRQDISSKLEHLGAVLVACSKAAAQKSFPLAFLCLASRRWLRLLQEYDYVRRTNRDGGASLRFERAQEPNDGQLSVHLTSPRSGY